MEQNFLSETIPFFSPMDCTESDELSRLFCEVHIDKGEKVGPKRGDVLYFVKEGFFQSEGVLKKSETVYLSKGSVIGSLPFTKEKIRGEVKAVSPAVLYSADVNSLNKFFLSHFPALRGYLRVTEKSGIPVSEAGSDILKRSSAVMTVCGSKINAGRSVASLYLAKKLSASGDAIVCDLSSTGLSVFDYCNKKLSPPIVQKKEGEKNDEYFSERITKVDKGVSLLNVNFGSKVSADSSLISPLLCYLSTEFNYIILDVDGSDAILEAAAISVSDFVIPVSGEFRDVSRTNEKFTGLLNEGQILVNAVRGYRGSGEPASESVLMIPEFTFNKDDVLKDVIFRTADEKDTSVEIVSRKRDYIAFTTGGIGSLYYAGLLPVIGESLRSGSIIKCHSFAYPLTAMYLADSETEYKSKVRKLFREEKIESLIQYSYPGDSLIRSTPVLKWASEVSGMLRIEDSFSRVVTSLSDEKGKVRIVSEGLLREIVASVLCRVPPCSFVKTSGGSRGAGSQISDSYMLRHPVGTTTAVSVIGDGINLASKRIRSAIRFGFLPSEESGGEKWIYDKNIVIDVNNIRFNIKGLMKESGKLWNAALSERKIKVDL